MATTRRRFRENTPVMDDPKGVQMADDRVETPVETPEPITVEPEVAAVPPTPAIFDDANQIPEVDQQIMEAGCRRLMAYIPEDTRELIEEYANSNPDVPLWQVIGGYAMRCREIGELMNPCILPDWAEMVVPGSPRQCLSCGLVLKTKTWSQRYCCNHCFFGKLKEMNHSEECALVG